MDIGRRFTAENKLRVLREADACKKPGELGALLRREGLYSSYLAAWRLERERSAKVDLAVRRRGPTARVMDPRIKQLEHENRQLNRRLQRAEAMLAIQEHSWKANRKQTRLAQKS